MAARTKSAHDEIAHIEDLIGDLDKRLRKLKSSARTQANGAEGDINAFVSDSLAGIMERVRESADQITEDFTQSATKAGTDAYKRVTEEMEYYPLATMAIAAGVGFLFGLSRR